MPLQTFHSGCALLSALRVFNDTLENESAPLHELCVDVAKLETAVSELTAILESQFKFDGAMAEVMDDKKKIRAAQKAANYQRRDRIDIRNTSRH